MPSCPRRSRALIDAIPGQPELVADWLRSLDYKEFDRICIASIITAIEEEMTAYGHISLRSIALMLEAIRERYRGKRTDRRHGEQNHNAKLNALQARIIKRVHIPRYRGDPMGVDDVALGRMFLVSRTAIGRVRNGRAWRCLDRRMAA